MRHFTAFLALAVSSLALAQTPGPSAAPSAPASGAQPAASQPAPAASNADKAAAPKRKEAPPQSALTAQLMYQLLLGEFTFRQGTLESTQSGFEVMLDAARRTGDPQLFKRATEMALQSRSGPNALQAARAWRTALPQSVEANRYELQVLIVLGRIQETTAPLRHTLDALPPSERESFLIALPVFYRSAADKTLAVQTVERALADAIKSPQLAPAAWSSIGRLRLQAGDPAGALNAATLGTASNAHVSTPSHWPALLAVQLMAATGTQQNKAAAETLVKNYLRTAAPKPEVQLGYARALIGAERPQEALTQLEQLMRRRPDFLDGWLALGSARAEQGQPGQAQTALERYLEMAARQNDKPADAQDDESGGEAHAHAITARQRQADMDTARLILAHLAQKRGDAKAADEWLTAVQSPDQMLKVATERAALLADQGQLEQGRALIRAVPERKSEDAMLKLRSEAQLLREHQHADDAYKLLSGALADNPDDKDLIYEAAMAAVKADRADDAERLLRRLIALDPQSAAAYNALGFDLADRGLRLEQAKQLIEKAVALAPNDAFIRDSLGWVHYRMGNLAEARRLLESAFRQQPDAEIAAHLGEVIWTQGEHDAARAIWRQGLSLDAKNETLQKTLTRFKIEQ